MTKTRAYSPSEIRASLAGPVPSIETPFHRDGRIDFEGLRRLIDFDLSAGAKALMLTAGNSHYLTLSDQEIAEVTRVTVEHTAGRAMVIAADRYFGTAQATEFAKFCRDLGANLLMLMPPDWGASNTPRTLADHYAAVSAIMPVMIVTNVFIPRGLNFGLETLRLVLPAAPGVIAVKDDMCGEFARKMSLIVYDRWAVVSGGQKQNHLNNHPYGCDGYLSTFLQLKPAVSHAYWNGIQKNDLTEARAIIKKYDYPFHEFIASLPGGFNAGIHGALELVGLAQRWRRPPYQSLTDAEMERLADLLRQLGVSR